MHKTLTGCLLVIGMTATSTVFAATTHPSAMGVDSRDYGWEYVYASAGDISSSCSGYSCTYETYQLPRLSIDATYGRVEKHGDSLAYNSIEAWYVTDNTSTPYGRTPTLAHPCDGTVGIWSLNPDLYLCSAVDTEYSYASTCDGEPCRKFYARESSAYDDSSLITILITGIDLSDYTLLKYRYTSSGSNYYRLFRIVGIN
jgi:hypothetical protein